MVVHEVGQRWSRLLVACLCNCHYDGGSCEDKACVAWGHAEYNAAKPRKQRVAVRAARS